MVRLAARNTSVNARTSFQPEEIDIERLRQKLEFQRQEVLQLLRRLDEEARSVESDSTQDTADRSVSFTSKESLIERSSQQRALLRLIEAAIQRIAVGSFGICAGCAGQIPAPRLKALPWTQFCITCQEAIEERVATSLSSRGSSLTRAGSASAGSASEGSTNPRSMNPRSMTVGSRRAS